MHIRTQAWNITVASSEIELPTFNISVNSEQSIISDPITQEGYSKLIWKVQWIYSAYKMGGIFLLDTMPQTRCSTRGMWHPLLQALYQSWARRVLTLPWCSKRIYSFSWMVFFILRCSIVDNNCLLCQEYVLRYYKLMLWVCLIRFTCASTCLYTQLHIFCN